MAVVALLSRIEIDGEKKYHTIRDRAGYHEAISYAQKNTRRTSALLGTEVQRACNVEASHPNRHCTIEKIGMPQCCNKQSSKLKPDGRNVDIMEILFGTIVGARCYGCGTPLGH